MTQTYWQQKKGIIGNFTTLKSFTEEGKDFKVRESAESFIIENNISKIVEFGCNTGIMPFRLRDKNWKGKYIGVDSNQQALDLAQKLLSAYRGLEFINHDVFNVSSLEDNSSEMVYMKDVIEHLEYYEGAVQEMMRISSKYILLSMFIPFNKEDKIYKHNQGYYLNGYGQEKFEKFVNQNNFSIKMLCTEDVYSLYLLEKRQC